MAVCANCGLYLVCSRNLFHCGCALAGCLVYELAEGLCTDCLVSVTNCMVYCHPQLSAEMH